MTNPLAAQFARLDALLEREILRLRARYQLSLDEFRGLYVSDEQVDRLVADTREPPRVATATSAEHPAAGACAAHPRWAHVVETFRLSFIEEDLLLIAAAPEFNPKYETLYAYLNNDVTRKLPTLDLAQRVLGDCGDALPALAPDAPLFRQCLLERVDPPAGRPALLNTGFALRAPAAFYLRGLAPVDPRFSTAIRRRAPRLSLAELPFPTERTGRLRRLAAICRDVRPPVLVFSGPPASGRAATAKGMAMELNLPVCSVDLRTAIHAGSTPGEFLESLALQLKLEPALLHLDGSEALCREDGRPGAAAADFANVMSALRVPIVLSAAIGDPWRAVLGKRRALEIRFGEHDFPERLVLWEKLLSGSRVELADTEVRALADRFALTAGQMRDAIATARDLNALDDRADTVDAAALAAAARLGSDQSLGRLAVKIHSRHSWSDLVLPPFTLGRLRELVSAVRLRSVVYGDWGFAQRSVATTGLRALFAGPSPGVGKTMAAGIIARELGLDLYKIDLSGVVSKYIGETEKNLDRIFAAARAANAIVFFDEAEAILGKRSEVKDAHDRYANIEVAYLLQKMEDHDGVIIMATNLRRNIDDAFNRRMQFVIDFPRPNEAERERLWRGMFPAQSPLGDDVDFRFLARQFDLAGGDIHNVALDAAFLAAQNGRVIDMRCLVAAMARQLAKQGKTPTAADFRQYQRLLGRVDAHDQAA